MTARALRRGTTEVTAPEAETRAAAGADGVRAAAARAGSGLVPIAGSDPLGAILLLAAVRAAGGVGVLTDDRRSADRRIEELGAIEAQPGPAADLVLGRTSDGSPPWASFTSGSSGAPRLVVRSHCSWSDSFPAVAELVGLTQEDTLLLTAPLSSSLSLFSVAHADATGFALRFPAHAAPAPGDLADATLVHTTPQGLAAVLDLIEHDAPHRLRTALVGGARLDPEVRARARVQGIDVVAYYGAAELSFVAVDPDGRGLRPFPGVETGIRDGELWVRSPYVAAGYLGSTGGAFRRDERGWATVGDLVDPATAAGLAEEDTMPPLRGRRDGAILTSSATVIPEDVEAALRQLAGVEDAVAFAVPHEQVGALVGVTIQIDPATPPPSAGQLRESARAALMPTHLPRLWFVAAALPRTAGGKPARAQIRDDALSGRTARLG